MQNAYTKLFDRIAISVGSFNMEIFAKSIPKQDQAYQDIILQHVVTLENWSRSYLACPHESLGRKGPVCPYIPLSIKQRKLILTYYPVSTDTKIDELTEIMRHHRTCFLNQKTKSPEDNWNQAIIIAFVNTNTSENKTNELVKQTQSVLKTEFIKRGTMIGQFFTTCEVEGIHNNSFRPFSSPLPCLAIRNIMPEDIFFLSDIPENAKIYLDTFEINNEQALIDLLKKHRLDKNKKALSYVKTIIQLL